jgi:hypothetical protein
MKACVAAWCLAFVLAAGRADAAIVTLSAAIQRRLAIVTTALAPARRADEIDAFAKVLDPEPLVQLQSDLRTAEAAAAASGAEAKRATALNAAHDGVSDKDMEAAVAQARSDVLRVSLLRRRLGLEWGPGVARLSPGALEALVAALARGSAALAHVDTHNDEGQANAHAVRIDIGDGSVTGVVIGPARAAEPRLQSSGLIVKVTGPSAILLSVGLTQSAHIEGPKPRQGVLAPRSALIRFEGSDWVYVRLDNVSFERRLVQDPIPTADGFFIAQGLAPGDRVVTQGAAGLFGAEHGGPSGR